MTMIWYALSGFVLIMTVSFLRHTPDKYDDFCVGVAIPIAMFLLGPLRLATSAISPVTMDVALHHADLALGLNGPAMTRWLIRTHTYFFVWPVYASLPLMMAATWIVERSRMMLRTAMIAPLLALPFYWLIPACGPQYAFEHFPAASSITNHISSYPRNCMPSMHFAWALVLLLNARNRFWRGALFMYLALMVVATVATGEHYFVDVIAAVPFTLAVQYLVESFSSRQAQKTLLAQRDFPLSVPIEDRPRHEHIPSI